MDYLPVRLKNHIDNCRYKADITEIRLRKNCPVQFTVFGKTVTEEILVLSEDELEHIFYLMCNCSVNTFDEEISNGYITLPGGNRVGIGGEFFFNGINGRYILKELMSLNIRIIRKDIYFENQSILFANEIKSTLIVGKPHSGKTSLLKLYVNHLAEQYRVAVCDERNEIYNGKMRCDVIRGIDKGTAITMATRSLNPEYIICDEIGTLEETEKILSAVNTGVKFICSAHGGSLNTVLKRPNIKILIENSIFDTVLLLDSENGKFYIKEIRNV